MRRILERIRHMNALNIERAYKHCDDAVAKLRAHNEDAESIERSVLDEIVAEAMSDANKVLALKSEKAWDGAFREMHEYLAKIHMELRQYDQAMEHGNAVAEYDRNEGEYLIKQIQAHESGGQMKDFDPSAVDESA
ncbi:hypothetical protein FJZ36_11095 [Candidatus Poribacteria bacterium]|nr:hypothetical protein [Candidatus Poribacteria bacterium]